MQSQHFPRGDIPDPRSRRPAGRDPLSRSPQHGQRPFTGVPGAWTQTPISGWLPVFQSFARNDHRFQPILTVAAYKVPIKKKSPMIPSSGRCRAAAASGHSRAATQTAARNAAIRFAAETRPRDPASNQQRSPFRGTTPFRQFCREPNSNRETIPKMMTPPPNHLLNSTHATVIDGPSPRWVIS